MSETEQHTGKLVKVIPQEGEGTENLAKRLVNENGYRYDVDYWECYLDCLYEEGYREYVIHNSCIYEVKCEDIDPCGDITLGKLLPNGDIDFTVRYYNGGCSFDEAVCGAIDKAHGGGINDK